MTHLYNEEEFSRLLTDACSLPVSVCFTCNRSSLLSVRKPARGAARIFVQHVFRGAGPEVILALARFVEGPDRRSREIIGAFLNESRNLIGFFARPARPGPLSDDKLSCLLKNVCEEYGISGQGLSICWSRARTKKCGRRSIRLGSFRHAERAIRIHPILQGPGIPEYFLAYIVYHEALHAAFPPFEANGRKLVHHELFRRRERIFRHYEQARRFEKDFVAAVLAGRWKG